MHSRQRLTIARDLLTGDVRSSTTVSLYGFTLRRDAPHASVWTVYDERMEAPVDFVSVSNTTSAVALLEHLEFLRQVVDEQANSGGADK